MTVTDLITIEQITGKIYRIRGVKVMLDRDLAELYEVENRVLNYSKSLCRSYGCLNSRGEFAPNV